MPSFQLSLGDEGLQVFANLGFLLKWYNGGVMGFVIGDSDKIFVALVGQGWQGSADVSKHMLKHMVSADQGLFADHLAGLLAIKAWLAGASVRFPL